MGSGSGQGHGKPGSMAWDPHLLAAGGSPPQSLGTISSGGGSRPPSPGLHQPPHAGTQATVSQLNSLMLRHRNPQPDPAARVGITRQQSVNHVHDWLALHPHLENAPRAGAPATAGGGGSHPLAPQAHPRTPDAHARAPAAGQGGRTPSPPPPAPGSTHSTRSATDSIGKASLGSSYYRNVPSWPMPHDYGPPPRVSTFINRADGQHEFQLHPAVPGPLQGSHPALKEQTAADRARNHVSLHFGEESLGRAPQLVKNSGRDSLSVHTPEGVGVKHVRGECLPCGLRGRRGWCALCW